MSLSNQIEKRLTELLQDNTSSYNAALEPARYLLLSGGKRIRPHITMLLARSHKALDPACAIEMIHTYSLIHDDLPALDNDDTRRGKPSTHIAFTEGQAILAGDLLLTYAFEVITNTQELTPDVKCKLVASLAKRSGACGMVGGQYLDITPNIPADKTTIDAGKTGALFTCAFEFGALLGGHNVKELSECGALFGLAYQLRDDLLDNEADLSVCKEIDAICNTLKTRLKSHPELSHYLAKCLHIDKQEGILLTSPK